jgi:GDPmannose 4,6-dehydratase
MTAILGLKNPGRFVISSGKLHSVQEFVSLAFSKAGLDYRNYVTENPARLLRRIPARFGNPKKLKELTGWAPETSFDELIEIMLKNEGVRLV